MLQKTHERPCSDLPPELAGLVLGCLLVGIVDIGDLQTIARCLPPEGTEWFVSGLGCDMVFEDIVFFDSKLYMDSSQAKT